MAEPHSIVVRVRDADVNDVQFCNCCPPVTVEVRVYIRRATTDAAIPTGNLSIDDNAASLMRDEIGLYRVSYHEPDVEDDWPELAAEE